MAKRLMFKSVKTTLWGVFYIGSTFGQFRMILAALPAWDGQVPGQSQCTAENTCIF